MLIGGCKHCSFFLPSQCPLLWSVVDVKLHFLSLAVRKGRSWFRLQVNSFTGSFLTQLYKTPVWWSRLAECLSLIFAVWVDKVFIFFSIAAWLIHIRNTHCRHSRWNKCRGINVPSPDRLFLHRTPLYHILCSFLIRDQYNTVRKVLWNQTTSKNYATRVYIQCFLTKVKICTISWVHLLQYLPQLSCPADAYSATAWGSNFMCRQLQGELISEFVGDAFGAFGLSRGRKFSDPLTPRRLSGWQQARSTGIFYTRHYDTAGTESAFCH